MSLLHSYLIGKPFQMAFYGPPNHSIPSFHCPTILSSFHHLFPHIHFASCIIPLWILGSPMHSIHPTTFSNPPTTINHPPFTFVHPDSIALPSHHPHLVISHLMDEDIAWTIPNLMSWVVSPTTIPITAMGGKSRDHSHHHSPGWQVLSDKVHSGVFFFFFFGVSD
jgi:hypothetical protein